MADLINLTALAAPTSILAPTNTGGLIATIAATTSGSAKRVLSGTLTAATYKEIIALSVPGWLRLCSVICEDATSRTLGLKIVIDGTTVFDSVSQTISAASSGFSVVGSATGGALDTLESFRFNASLSLQIKSSLSETDKISLQYLTAV